MHTPVPGTYRIPGAHRVRSGAARAPGAGTPRLVVVGNGMVGHRLCELLMRQGPRRYDVTIFAEETRPAYDRVHLGEVLRGRSAESLLLSPAEWYAKHHITLNLADAVVGLDLNRRVVHSARGVEVGYDRLVLATGSVPVLPPIKIDDWTGVFVLRTVEDVERVRTGAAGRRRPVIVGGGLLGLETASTLQQGGHEPIVIETADRLMSRQLDREAADVLRRRLEAAGIVFRLSTTVTRVAAAETGKRVLLSDGSELEADFVVLAAGARPRDNLAMWGLVSHARGGFLVNDLLETSDPRVYAIGECAALGDRPFGTVSPGYAMAECLARTLLGSPVPFRSLPACVRLKIAELPVAVAGEVSVEAVPPIVAPTRPGVHRSIQVRQGRLVGAQAVGQWMEWERVEDAVRFARPIADWQIERFRRGEPIWPDTPRSVALPIETIVCSCNGVTSGGVEAAISAGCQTVRALSERTGAATTCGSCVPYLERLLDLRVPGRAHSRSPLRFLGLLTLLATAAVVGGRTLLERFEPEQLPFLDHLLRRPSEQRLTGFVLVGLMAMALLLPIVRRLAPRATPVLRVAHLLTGFLLVLGLAVHTGLRLGVRFNQVVTAGFLALACLGGFASVAMAGRSVRASRATRFVHEALFWPALALLGLHVLAVYYF